MGLSGGIIGATAGAGSGPNTAGLALAFAMIARPPSRGRNRFLQGCPSSSSSTADLAAARSRLGSCFARGTSPESRRMKGMCRPAGKQLWNCARDGRSAVITGGELHSRVSNKVGLILKRGPNPEPSKSGAHLFFCSTPFMACISASNTCSMVMSLFAPLSIS